MNDESEMNDLAFSEVEAMSERLYAVCRRYCLLFERGRSPTGDTVGSAGARVYEVAAIFHEAPFVGRAIP
jgi:hypothetical protein